MPDQVAEPADRRHYHRHADHIDDEHPLDLIEIGTDAGHDFWDGDVDDGGIESEQERTEHNRPCHPPFIGRPQGECMIVGCRWAWCG